MFRLCPGPHFRRREVCGPILGVGVLPSGRGRTVNAMSRQVVEHAILHTRLRPEIKQALVDRMESNGSNMRQVVESALELALGLGSDTRERTVTGGLRD